MNFILSSGNTNLPQKYIANRDLFQTGDLVLYRGTSFLSKAIQYFDQAYYNHIGVVVKSTELERNLTLDMWAEGLAFVPLSRRVAGYKDFCILRPKVEPNVTLSAIKEVVKGWDGHQVSYDKMLLLRVALIKKTGIDITGLGDKNKFICSEFAQYYSHLLGFSTYDSYDLITPQDFMRYIDENYTILLHDAIAK